MNRFKYVLLGCLLLLTACQSDPQEGPMPPSPAGGFAFSLLCDGFEEGSTRSEQPSRAGYDKVAFSVIDAEGFAVDGLKGVYDPATSVLRLEGLREGDYRLLLLGIRGDEQADGVTIHTLRTIGDEWLSFPEDLRSPLQTEYFYSQTPFSVVATAGADGTELTVTGDREPVQQRIIGRTDFTFAYNNPYVETALLTQRVTLTAPRFRTGMTGDGAFTGTGTGSDLTLPLDGTTSYLFPPTVTDEPLCGEVEVTTRDYRGSNVRRSYGFTLRQVAPNRIGTILTRVEHPDDRSAVAFVTETALESIGLAYILQDDEPHTVYTDRTQRSFNTAAPLQVTTTNEGKLHVRFYSPRELTDVLIRARIPSVSNEFFDMAYFDRTPAFADFYGGLEFRRVLFRSRRTADCPAPCFYAYGLGCHSGSRTARRGDAGHGRVRNPVGRPLLGQTPGHPARLEHRLCPLRRRPGEARRRPYGQLDGHPSRPLPRSGGPVSQLHLHDRHAGA